MGWILLIVLVWAMIAGWEIVKWTVFIFFAAYLIGKSIEDWKKGSLRP